MFSRYTVYVALLVVVLYIVTSEAQKSTETGVAAADGAVSADTPKSAGQPAAKPKVRKRKRRRRIRGRRRKGGKAGAKTKGPGQPVAAAQTVKVVQETVPVDQPVVAVDAPRAEAMVVKVVQKEAAPIVARAQETAVAPQKAQKASMAAQDEFFNLFDMTTTQLPDVGAPPPEFDPNAPPRKKVFPNVDTRNSKAYDGTPCNETYKGHETIHTKYMMRLAEGVWDTLDCPPNLGSGLVWRQDLCSCGEELIAQDPNDGCALEGFNAHPENQHKYMRRHHGVDAVMDCAANLVWSQAQCQCMFSAAANNDKPIEQKVTFVCKTILQMKFEGNLKNTAQGYYVQVVNLRRRGKLPRIRYRKVPGSTNKAAMIVSQPLEFLAYRGNDFQLQVTYSVSFKVSPRHSTRNNFMLLLTDECVANPGGSNKARKPSISLSFQPNTKKFRLGFRTENVEIDELISGAKPDKHGWYNIVVYFEDMTLNLENNGVKLYQQGDIAGKIPQNKCPLYIAGRGQGYDRSQDFYGYLDNVNLIKDCKFHEANIKFL